MKAAQALPPSIGIIGGMGPWVDPLLLRKMLAYQVALGLRRDQDAAPTLLAQFPALIEDRTGYLASLEQGPARANPALSAARLARVLVDQGACVLGIPCNTFHAAPIFTQFEQELADLTAGPRLLAIIHLVRATVRELRAGHPDLRRVGILSTNGVYSQGTYSELVRAAGLEAVTLPYERRPFPDREQDERKAAILDGRLAPAQNDVHHAIYHPEWGIKSGAEAPGGYSTARAILKAAAHRLQQLGAQAVILGCTEIPLAIEQADVTGLPLHDPLDSLAKGLVDAYRERAK